MTPRLVLFDLDGTLVDAYQAIHESSNHILRTFDKEEIDYDTARRSVGKGIKAYMQTLIGSDEWEKAAEIYTTHHLKALSSVVLQPGAMELLLFLKQKGLFLAVASNRPSKSGLRILELLTIHSFFQKTLFGDQITHPKPNPEIILELIRFFQCKKEETLFIGDMPIDGETGNNAGVRTFLLPTGSSSLEEITLSRPEKIFTSLVECLGFIKERFF
ncbi:MAG: HAD-IA family hydrolase [Candidatus Ratteibacteria bacterium]|jgi:phosphoglycolate phosphatase